MSDELNNQIPQLDYWKMMNEALSNRRENEKKVAEYQKKVDDSFAEAQIWAKHYFTKEALLELSEKSKKLLGYNDFNMQHYIDVFEDSRNIELQDINDLINRDQLIKEMEQRQDTNNIEDEPSSFLSRLGRRLKGGAKDNG